MRGLREIRRGGCGLIVVACVAGCGIETDQSWRPSFKESVIGRELVVVEPTTVERFDGKFTSRPFNRPSGEAIPAGTRLRIVKAIHKGSLVMMPAQNALLATIVGRESFGRVWVASYEENPTRISTVRLGMLTVPRVPPAWLDASASPPSASAADVGTLRAAIVDQRDADVSRFAAREIVRRAIDDASPDRQAARDVIVGCIGEGVPFRSLNTLGDAAAAMPKADVARYQQILEPFFGRPTSRR